MDNLQFKLQKGISNVQRGLEDGKGKFQSSKELIDMRTEVSRLEEERSLYVLRLGEIYYGKLRKASINELGVEALKEEIVRLDREIYQLLKELDRKSKLSGVKKCKCGASVSVEDNFCKQCGEKVEFISIDPNNIITCPQCSTVNSKDNKFCNCCGTSII